MTLNLGHLDSRPIWEIIHSYDISPSSSHKECGSYYGRSEDGGLLYEWINSWSYIDASNFPINRSIYISYGPYCGHCKQEKYLKP